MVKFINTLDKDAELVIREDFVDATLHCRYGDCEWYEPFTNNLPKLYKSLVKDYGRCCSKIYVDHYKDNPKHIGWVFEKTLPYEDYPKKLYKREVWVTLGLKEQDEEVSAVHMSELRKICARKNQ